MSDALAPLDFARRARMVREALDAQGVDGMIVTNLVDIRWLTGFTGSNAMVWIAPDRLVLCTDGRYADQAPAELAAAGVAAEVVIRTDLLAALAAFVAGRAAVDADHLSWAAHGRLIEAVEATVVPVEVPLVAHRAAKDPGEVSRMRQAAAIADAALAEVASGLAGGPTEREVALALEVAMRRRGATASAYETIVASGPNSALPHGRPTDRVIGPGDLVIIDVGALYDGYRSDMTRTYCLGQPDLHQQRQLDIVLEAHQAGVAAVRAGVPSADVDGASRSVVAAAGWGDAFTHGTGHGVGLEIHESPAVNSRTRDVLRAGMVVTVEPGVYLPGEGGVRWEDMLLVLPDGAETLSGTPKEPVVSL